MRRYKPQHIEARNRRRTRILAAIGLILLGVFLLSKRTVRTSPQESLVQAVQILSQPAPLSPENLSRALQALALTERSPHLLPWALLTRSAVEEIRGENPVETLREIPSDSAASIDAQLRLLRLALERGERQSLETLTALTTSLRAALRTDLEGELALTEALLRENEGDRVGALSALHRARKEKLLPIMQVRARTKSETLLESLKEDAGYPEYLKREAELLEQEKLFSNAQERIQDYRLLLPKDSPESGIALLTEERLLRKMKRGEEADQMLLDLTASPHLGVGDEALFRIAKNGWNINDNHRALEFLSRFFERFPDSPLRREARYIEARMLEEISQPGEAREIYTTLAKDGPPLDRVRSLKRLAWLYFTRGDYTHGAESFDTIRSITLDGMQPIRNHFRSIDESTPPTPETVELGKQFTELLEEHLAASYFLGDALARLEPVAKRYLTTQNRDERTVWELLLGRAPFSYYGLLAAKRLSLPLPVVRRTGGCSFPISTELRERLESFSNFPELSAFAQNELNFAFIAGRSGLYPLSEDEPWLNHLRSLTTRARVASELIEPHRGVELAELGLRRLTRRGEANPVSELCEQELRSIAFPEPYFEAFRVNAERANAPLELLLAIARTESFFNPRAESIAGAQGIVQVMPKTAKAEGWNGTNSLFQAEENLQYGAKHINRLLGEFNGERAYAIAAYNAGSSPVNRWRSRYERLDVEPWIELIGYPETQKYVKRVLFAETIYRGLLLEKGN